MRTYFAIAIRRVTRRLAAVSLFFILVGCVNTQSLSSKNPLQQKVDEIAQTNSIELARIFVNEVWKKPVQQIWTSSSPDHKDWYAYQNRWGIASNNLTAVPVNLSERTNCRFENDQFSNSGKVQVTAYKKRSAPDTFNAMAAKLKRTHGEAAAISKIAQLRSRSKILRVNLSLQSSECETTEKRKLSIGVFPLDFPLLTSELKKSGVAADNCVPGFSGRDSFSCFLDYEGEFREYYSRIGKSSPGYIGLPGPSFKLTWLSNYFCESGICFTYLADFQNIVTVKNGDETKSPFEIQKEYLADPVERARIDDYADFAIAAEARWKKERHEAGEQMVREGNRRYAEKLARDKIINDNRLERVAAQRTQERLAEELALGTYTNSGANISGTNSGADISSDTNAGTGRSSDRNSGTNISSRTNSGAGPSSDTNAGTNISSRTNAGTGRSSVANSGTNISSRTNSGTGRSSVTNSGADLSSDSFSKPGFSSVKNPVIIKLRSSSMRPAPQPKAAPAPVNIPVRTPPAPVKRTSHCSPSSEGACTKQK